MAFSYSLTSPSPNSTLSYSSLHQSRNPSSSFPVSLSISSPNNTRHLRLLITSALNPQTGQPTKKTSNSGSGGTNKKRKKKGKSPIPKENWELRDADVLIEDDDDDDGSRSLATFPTIPKPPAGFVIDETGRVLMASKKRIATVVDPTNNSPLDCVPDSLSFSPKSTKSPFSLLLSIKTDDCFSLPETPPLFSSSSSSSSSSVKQ